MHVSWEGGSSLGRMALAVSRVGVPWAGWLQQLGGWEFPGQDGSIS